ncbi:MAG: ABC transporter permease [Bacteroidetes bacterium]|nr:ABC transporter permease [Bacteroidota bacterium]
MNFYLTAVLLGLGFASLALGIFISMRIFNIPDITTDGSFTLGGAVTAVLLSQHVSMPVIFVAAFLSGAIAGAMTGFIHTRLKVNALLAGILVMTALYSVNLALMGRSNIPLIDIPTIFSLANFIHGEVAQQAFVLVLFVLLLWQLMGWVLKTDFGLAMRATGNNESMIRALGVNTNRMKIIGLGLANGLTALSGFLITQIQGFADINMGIGIVILGLGSVMIGEIFSKTFSVKSIYVQLIAVIAGSVIFRLILAFALSIGIDPLYLKLVVAAFVLLVVSIPNLKKAND